MSYTTGDAIADAEQREADRLQSEHYAQLLKERDVLLDLINHCDDIRYKGLYLCNRANAVRGNWCIGRKASDSITSSEYWQFWTGERWSGFGKNYTDILEAVAEIERINSATNAHPTAPDAL